MFQAADRPELARNTLVDGLKYHSADLEYLNQTFSFLFLRQEDQRVVDLVNHLLSDSPASDPRISTYLGTVLATAYFYRGHFDQAEDTIRANGLQLSTEGRFLSAKIEWDRGFQDLAVALIAQLARENPQNANIYRTHIKWLLETDQADQARHASLLRRISFPEQPQPRIDLLYAYDRMDDDQAVSEEALSLLSDFHDDANALLMLGDFAANAGRPKIAEKVYDQCIASALPSQGPALMLVEAHTVAGNHDRSIALARELLEQHPDWEKSMAPIFNGLQAIAFFALGDRESSSLYLDSFLNLPSVRAENLVAVANRLIDVGAVADARRVLEHAVRTDRLNQPALARLIEFELEATQSPNLPSNLRRLLEMRRPSLKLLSSAYQRLGRDQFIYLPSRNALLDDISLVLTGNPLPGRATDQR
ncbi:tetratricopeptide repeat protein [Synoicihabitans lomoniglobus]|uniref:Tetratricopeptide repeat protein n=1 Tax=Synoicihabitans lomoniglobus TaxID=2909285 RepID=A0AAF0CPP7_9BACT|nr:hypothetical protein [Opitutaceae bacterium LMO-M01]WED65768.1 hypothetical protein PXH66_02770 [Opitutaceae bacterium LMO-M01]